MANPVVVFVGTYVGGGGAAQSGVVTFSYQNTAGFDVTLPIQMTCPGTTSISAGAEVVLYRSGDGGATWETQGVPGTVFIKPSVASQVQRAAVTLTTGQYLIGVQVGGGSASTWTAQTLTALVVTAYI